MVVEQKPVQIWQSFSGRLEAVDYVEIRPQVTGTIKDIKFADGQIVNKGDVLLIIDPAPYEAAANQAKADLQSARDQATLAQKDLARAQDLIKTGAIPKRVLDERQSGAQVTKSAIAAAAARLDQAKIDVDRAYVKAPISGRIGRAERTIGNLVQAGPNAPLLTSIVSSDGIYADFQVDEETYLKYVRGEGAADAAAESQVPVRMTLNSDKATVYQGRVQSFDNRIDTTSGTIRARALFPNENGRLLPGMFATIEMGGAGTQDSITVPERAVSTDQDRKFVYVIGADKALAYREITPGAVVEGQRVVLSGLKPGEIIVTEGLIRLRPGMKVAPQIKKPPVPAAGTLKEKPQDLIPQDKAQ